MSSFIQEMKEADKAGPYTLETGYERDVGCSITGIARTVICQFQESVRVGKVELKGSRTAMETVGGRRGSLSLPRRSEEAR